MRPARPIAAAFLLGFAVTCLAHAKTGAGHGSSSCGGGGHGGAGHMAAHAGSVGHVHGGMRAHCGGAYGYGTSYDYGYGGSSIDPELHERVLRTESAKNAFVQLNPCPANGLSTGSCPGYVISCVDPDPADPGRCLDVAHLAWRPVQRADRSE